MIKRFLWDSTAAWGLVILITLALRKYNHGWMGVLAACAPQPPLLIICALLITATLGARAWLPLTVNVAAAAVVAFAMGDFKIAGPGFSPPDLDVLTYNIQAGLAGTPAILKVLTQREVDVIFLQEARRPLRGGKDPLPAIAAALPGMKLLRGRRTNELAILVSASFAPGDSHELPLGAGRCALIWNVAVYGHPLRLINVHLNTAATGRSLRRSLTHIPEYLAHTNQVRWTQIAALQREVTSSPVPCILAGDFNTPPQTRWHSAMTADLADAFDEAGAGFGWTWSAKRPLWRIDYVLLGSGLRATHCETMDDVASDHRAVLAGIQFQR